MGSRNYVTVAFVLMFLGTLSLSQTFALDQQQQITDDSEAQVRDIINLYNQVPIYFEVNEGQTADEVRYMARTEGYTLFLTDYGAVFSLALGQADDETSGFSSTRYGLRLNFVGANPHPVVIGEAQQEGVSSYFIGSRENWHTSIAHYGQIRYQELYDGIDAVFYGNPQQLQYDFILEPYADPNQIRLEFDPAESLTVTDDGDLLLDIGGKDLIVQAPYSYQMVNGIETVVDSHFVVSNGKVSFGLGDYDASLPLTIDPVLVYASFLGGTGNDIAYGVDIDSSGNAYIVGLTNSNEANFPVTVGPDITYGGGLGGDGFIKKLNAAGTAIIYAGYIGGSGNDRANDVAVDAAGNAYVTGQTASNESTFPVSGGPVLTHPGGNTAFIVKVNVAGTGLVYGGYIAAGSGNRIAVDSTGNAYVTGAIGGISVHKVNPAGTGFVYQHTVTTGTGRGIAVDSSGVAYVTGVSSNDSIVAKINAAGDTTDYLVTLGGSGTENGYGVAVDSAGNAYAVGQTNSANFPITNALYPTLGGNADAYLAKLDPSGTILFATYIGGSGFDAARAVQVDAMDNVYVSGQSTSTNFPALGGPDLTKNGNSLSDAFIAQFDPDGTRLIYSGFIGGTGNEIGDDLVLDSNRNVYLVGVNSSNDGTFPDGDGPGSIPGYATSYIGGFNDGFIAKVGYPIYVELSAATASVAEGNTGTNAVSNLSLIVGGGVLNNDSSITLTLTDGTATTADTDYSQTSSTITIPAGNYTTPQSIAIPLAALGIVGDTTDEPDEDFTLTLDVVGISEVVVADANADTTIVGSTVYTILNDDAYMVNVEFSAATASGAEGDSGTNPVTSPMLTVGGDVLPADATVEIALTDGTATLADNDYAQTLNTVTIPAGDYTTPQNIAIPVAALGIIGDTTDEPDEDLTLTLQNPTGIIIGDANTDTATTNTAVYTILNDDGVVITVEFSAAAASGIEGDSGTTAIAAPTLLVGGGVLASDGTVDIVLADGTATTADNDYTQTLSTVTIPAGDYSTAQSIDIPVAALGIVGDTAIEPDENVLLSLQNASGVITGDTDTDTLIRINAAYTILDDDDPDSVAEVGNEPSISIFDPALSKIGLLIPGQTGVTGEQIEWVTTVRNTGGGTGNNITIVDNVDSRLQINNVNAPGASVSINGQTVEVTYGTINSGESVQFSIFTTVLRGESVNNTICIAGTDTCATGSAVGELPSTGETPWWRGWLFFGLATIVVAARHLL